MMAGVGCKFTVRFSTSCSTIRIALRKIRGFTSRVWDPLQVTLDHLLLLY